MSPLKIPLESKCSPLRLTPRTFTLGCFRSLRAGSRDPCCERLILDVENETHCFEGRQKVSLSFVCKGSEAARRQQRRRQQEFLITSCSLARKLLI